MDEINKSDVENIVSSDDVNQLNQNNNELDNTNTESVISDEVTKPPSKQQQQQQQSPAPSSASAAEVVAEEADPINERIPTDTLAISHNANIDCGDGGESGSTAGGSSMIEQNEDCSSSVTKCDDDEYRSDEHQTSDAPEATTTTPVTESLPSGVTEMEHEPIEQPVINTQDEPPPDPPDEQMQNEPAIEIEAKPQASEVAVENVAVASPKPNPCESPHNTDRIVNDENVKSVEHPSSDDNSNNHKNYTDHDNDTDTDNNQMSQLDNSEDLLVPTDYVPDSADVIGDDSKRRHSLVDEASEEPFKKFKHDTISDDDVSMGDSVDDLSDMCTESEVNDQPMAAMAAAAAAAAVEAAAAAAAEAEAAAAVAAAAATTTTTAETSVTANETEEKIPIAGNDEQPSSLSASPSQPKSEPEPSLLTPSTEATTDHDGETATNNDHEINIAKIFSSNGSDKTFSLIDIIDNADDLISKNKEQNESKCADPLQNKSNLSSELCGDDVVDNSAAAPVVSATSPAAIKSDTSSAIETEKNLTPSSETDLNFDISEKLKEMGEISLAPVSKSAKIERKPSLADFDLGDEISLEQIKKGATSGDSDDKRNKVTNLRKNIREVMDDNQLDASTLAAQREELERLARVQEQQRMIREMQRQVALDRQNSKTQNKVLSLLTGHTSLLKSSSAASASTSSPSATAAAPGTDEMGSVSSGTDVDDILAGKSSNLTLSVSIAPIKPSQKKSSEPNDAASDITSKSIEPCEIDLDSDEKFSQLDKSDDNDLMIVDEDSEEEDEDDDDVVELKAKRDIVEIEDSSDDDCIM